MALTMRVESDGYAYQEPILYLTAEVIQASREKFELFRERGTIQAEDYGADLWYITDEVHKRCIRKLLLSGVKSAMAIKSRSSSGLEVTKKSGGAVNGDTNGRR